MTAKTGRKVSASDLIWLCRRLALALQWEPNALSALESLTGDAPPGASKAIEAMRREVAAGRRMSDGLSALGSPGYVWGTLLCGEHRAAPAAALERIADHLEFEASLPRIPAPMATAWALALARLALMCGVGVPVLTALETAGGSSFEPCVREALLGAREAVRQGSELSDALETCASALPPLTLDMIRDAEREGRLADALPVIADYILDSAPPRSRRRKQEA